MIIGKYDFYLDGYYKQNLDILLKEAIPNNWDSFVIVFGMEGAGKTTFTSQSCLYTDPRYGNKSVSFLPNDFNQKIDSCKPESAIHWDEAITGANASMHASRIQNAVISKLTQIRKKKLKIFICFPYLWMLRKYFLERCLFGVYTYAKDFDDRGHAFFYSQPRLIKLYHQMKNVHQDNQSIAVKKSIPNFWFKYSKTLCLDEKKYDDDKESARVSEDAIKSSDLWKYRYFKLFKHLNKDKRITWDEAAALENITRGALIDSFKKCERKSLT